MRYRALAFLFTAVSVSAFAADPGDAIRLHGTVVIRTQQYETIIAVRRGDSDGPVEHAFRVWSKPAAAIDGAWRGVDVEYSGTALVVTFPTEQRLITLTVAGTETPRVPIPDAFSTTGYTVLGLGHAVGEKTARMRVASNGPAPYLICDDPSCMTAEFESPDPWGGSGGGSCYSGGLGATSCSQSNRYGSCSISCGSQSYACCTNPASAAPSCGCKVY
jgi:hypothetical protein